MLQPLNSDKEEEEEATTAASWNFNTWAEQIVVVIVAWGSIKISNLSKFMAYTPLPAPDHLAWLGQNFFFHMPTLEFSFGKGMQ